MFVTGRDWVRDVRLRALAVFWVALLIACRATATPETSSPSATPSAASPAAKNENQTVVALHDTAVFALHAGHGQKNAKERAAGAAKALEQAVASAPGTVEVRRQADAHVVYVDDIPIVQLFERDAALAGDASLDVHAAAIAGRVREVVQAEKKRRAIADLVFSLSLVVFLGLVSVYLLKKAGEFALRAREWITLHPERVPALHIRSMELVGSATVRAMLTVAFQVAKWVARLAIVYAYLLVVSSMFEATRGYAEKLTALVLSPLSALANRLASAVPGLLVAVVAAVVVLLFLRFVSLFFQSVERGEANFAGIPRELAAPTSLVVRAGIVLVALVFAAPIVAGDEQGALAKLGSFFLALAALSVAPVLASAVVGAFVVFQRQIRVGDQVVLDGRRGVVTRLGLLEMVVREPSGHALRVPHLLRLFRPLRVEAERNRTTVELGVDPGATQTHVKALLIEAAARTGTDPRVELVKLDGEGALYALSIERGEDSAERLLLNASEALSEAGIALGRARTPRGAGR